MYACMPTFTLFDIVAFTVVATTLLYLAKVPIYYSYVLAFRNRGTGPAPTSVPRILGWTFVRMALGYVILGGNLLMLQHANSSEGNTPLMLALGLLWLYGGRYLAWLLVGACGLKLRGAELQKFSFLGVAVNFGCELLALSVFYVFPLIFVYILAIIALVIFTHRAMTRTEVQPSYVG